MEREEGPPIKTMKRWDENLMGYDQLTSPIYFYQLTFSTPAILLPYLLEVTLCLTVTSWQSVLGLFFYLVISLLNMEHLSVALF